MELSDREQLARRDWASRVQVERIRAARGIGRAICTRLAADGAAICVNYSSNEKQAETLVEELQRGGTKAIAVRADVADSTEANALVAQAAKELGPPTILVNRSMSSRAR